MNEAFEAWYTMYNMNTPTTKNIARLAWLAAIEATKSNANKIISKEPTEDDIGEICYNVNRKYNYNPLDSALLKEIWHSIVFLAKEPK